MPRPVAPAATGREVQVVDAGMPVPVEDVDAPPPAVYRPDADEKSDANESQASSDPEPQIRSVQEVLSRFRRPDAAETAPAKDTHHRRRSDESRELNGVAHGSEDESLPVKPSKPSSTMPIPIGKTAEESRRESANENAQPTSDHVGEDTADREAADMSPLARYLRDRTVRKPAAVSETKPRTAQQPAGKLIRDFDTLKDRFTEQLDTAETPAALITPISASNALPEAIQLARPLAQGGKTVLLLDMAQGATTVSDFLGLKRSPGFNELLANAAAFEDVLHVDRESPLQVIPAGNPDLAPPPSEVKSFVRILDALRQTYDCVVIHSDFPRAKHFAEALNGELTTAVALFAPETFGDEEAELEKLKALDCPFLLYERAEAADAKGASLRERLAAS
jgi:hypothetical protein